jgi:hypothetical protein
MKSDMNKRVLILACLMAVVPALTVSAETPPLPPSQLPGFPTGSIGRIDELPSSREEYVPQSGTSKVTMGTITTDADAIMSVFDFNSLQAGKYFGFVGVDESIQDGLNLSFGTRFGKNNNKYFGVSYNGSLINDLAKILTNQNIIGMKKQEKISAWDVGGVIETHSVPDLVDGNNDSLSANDEPYTSDNTLSFLIGSGIVGFRLGFSEFLQGTKIIDEKYHEITIESSLKPFFELGFNFGVGGGGRFRLKPALRFAYDVHQYNATQYWGSTAPATSAFTQTEKLIRLLDFDEPSVGLTLGFDFNHSDHTQAEFDLDVDLAYRIYKNNDKYGVTSIYEDGSGVFIYDAVNNGLDSPTEDKMEKGLTGGLNLWGKLDAGDGDALPITHVRVPLKLGFTYRNDFTRRFSLGFKANLASQIQSLALSQTEIKNAVEGDRYHTIAIKASITPDVSVGAKFALLPDHFALQGGLGIELFSYEQTVTTTYSSTDPDKFIETVKNIGVPRVSLAGGLTLNFTKNTALDLLVFAAQVNDIDQTKFTMQFTFQK